MALWMLPIAQNLSVETAQEINRTPTRAIDHPLDTRRITQHRLCKTVSGRSSPSRVRSQIFYKNKLGKNDNTGKYSPSVAGNTNGGIPMKLAEMRGENEVDSDQEERNGLMQDRMRLKKNISANGNYTLSKAAPNQGGANNGQG